MIKKQTMVKRNKGGVSYVGFIETETSSNAPVGSYSGGLAKNAKHR